MSKPLLGLILGAFLGIFDGWSAQWTAGDVPEVRRDMVFIICMGVLKGAVAGVLIGVFARWLRSLPLGILLGLSVGALLAFPIALGNRELFWKIMLPGALVGLLVGIATQIYGRSRSTVAASGGS
jgi:hypothetical protein